MSENEEKNINQLSMIEQNLSSLLMQRQNFQAQLMEIDSALAELDKTENAYRIIGNIMVSQPKEEIKKDLDSKKMIIDLRIKTLEKKEKELKEKANKLQSDVLKHMKND